MVKTEFIERIMEQFLPELVKKFTIRKISTLTKLSYDATYRHVHFLIKEKALNEEKVGAYSNIGLNLNSDSAKKIIEKISLQKTKKFLKTDVVLKKMLDELANESRKTIPNELLSIVLYGSHAKGTQKEDSDVDVLFLVSSFKVSEKLERISSAVERRYGKMISPLITTPIELNKMIQSEKPMVAHEILLDGMVLYGYEKYYSVLFEAVLRMKLDVK
jgi:predicted nucleotidyltransferase